MFCYALRHYSISQEVLGVSWGTNTHRLTTLSLTCIHPESLSEARTWARPSLVCPIVCFMQEGKSRCDCEKYRYWTGSASGTNNHSTNEHKTNPNKDTHLTAGTVANPKWWKQKQADFWQDRHDTTFNFIYNDWRQHRHTATSLKGRKIINNLLSWILCQIQY